MAEGKIRILCIDDEARILRALKALFREHEVHATSEPKLAIRWAKEKDIDVIVCDQRMPLCRFPAHAALACFGRRSAGSRSA